MSRVFGMGKLAAGVMGVVLASGAAYGQTASSHDKTFLEDTIQDSNYEIKTAQLALQKSSSADVKQYANMIVTDHTALEQQTAAAAKAANTDAKPTLDMSIGDAASYAKLKVLSGDSFDQAYLKDLVKGNVEGMNEAKSEAHSSTVPAVKQLAQHRVALETKHGRKAQIIAQAHHIPTGQ